MDTKEATRSQEKILHVRLPADTYRRLRHEAVERGMTNAQVIIEAIDGPANINSQPRQGG